MQLRITNLSKRYSNGVQALSNISLNISAGMFGLLGPNGAGKSTLMRTLATVQEADSGSVEFDDIDVLRNKGQVRRILGYLPQDFGLYPNVNALELLDHFAVLKGLSNRSQRKAMVDALLHQTNLYEARHKPLGSFSGGMRQRFGIAQALLGNPKLIIVDEPTAGLDPEERVRFHNLLSDIGANKVVILSTHIVNDVSDMCPNMAVIDQGKLLLTGDPLDLIANIQGLIWTRYVNKSEIEKFKENYLVISTRMLAGRMLIRVFSEEDPGEQFELAQGDLEDVYFSAIAGCQLTRALVL